MKKGEKVEISYKYKKEFSYGLWLEDMNGEKILKKGEKVYHYSPCKIKGFEPRWTCFALDPEGNGSGYMYELTALEDITYELVDDDEARIDLEEFADKVEIYYVGTINVEIIRDEHGRTAGKKYNYRLAKEWKHLNYNHTSMFQ